jgi:hypothetical protein
MIGMSRKVPLALGTLAIVGMGTGTVACGRTDQKPADTTPTSSAVVSETDKAVRTNVTRGPNMSAQPPAHSGTQGNGCGTANHLCD